MKQTTKRTLKNSALILLGSFAFALSLAVFLSPAELVAGGASGIAVLLAEFIPLGAGTLFLLLNLPLLLAGLFKFGKRFMLLTLLATLLSSLLTELLSRFAAPFLPLSDDRLLSALFGGAACGAGLGLVFRAGATTGGTDIAVRFLRQRFPHLKTGLLFFLIDISIVAACTPVFGDLEASLYSTVALLVTSTVMDLVLYGRDRSRLLFIISDQSDTVAARLLHELDVGLTRLPASGAYSGQDKTMLFCVVKTRRFPKVRALIAEIDPCAFLVVAGANEIYGEGFQAHSGKD